jgi:hypothetical protein
MTGNEPPSFANYGKGDGTIIRHREYIGDLTTGVLSGTSTVFSLIELSINPGNTAMFPWLANIAENYQYWEAQGIVIELKSESSTYAANMAMGAMFIATSYNSLDAPPVDKLTLLNMEFSTSTKPSCDQYHMVECSRSRVVQDKLYVANDDNYQGGDPRFSNLGRTYIGSYGCPIGGTKIAEIWVTYQIALFRPIFSPFSMELISAKFHVPAQRVTDMYGAGVVRADNSHDGVQLSIVSDSSSSITYTLILPNQKARYLLSVTNGLNNWVGSPTNSLGLTYSSRAAVNCTLLNYFPIANTYNGVTSAFCQRLSSDAITGPTPVNSPMDNVVIDVDGLVPDELGEVKYSFQQSGSGTSTTAVFLTSLVITTLSRAIH